MENYKLVIYITLQVGDIGFDICRTLFNPVCVTFLLISESLNLIEFSTRTILINFQSTQNFEKEKLSK